MSIIFVYVYVCVWGEGEGEEERRYVSYREYQGANEDYWVDMPDVAAHCFTLDSQITHVQVQSDTKISVPAVPEHKESQVHALSGVAPLLC